MRFLSLFPALTFSCLCVRFLNSLRRHSQIYASTSFRRSLFPCFFWALSKYKCKVLCIVCSALRIRRQLSISCRTARPLFWGSWRGDLRNARYRPGTAIWFPEFWICIFCIWGPPFFYLLLSFRTVRVYMQNVFFRKERETPYLKGKRVLHMRFSVICRICRIIFTLRFYFCKRDPENGVDFQSAGTQHNSLSSGFWGG